MAEQKSIKVTIPDEELCPEGVFKAMIKELEEGSHPEYGEFIIIRYLVQIGPTSEDIRLVDELANIGKFTKRSKLRKRYETLVKKIDSETEAGKDVEIMDLEGKVCTVVIVHEEKEGVTVSKVDSVTPYKKPESTKKTEPQTKKEPNQVPEPTSPEPTPLVNEKSEAVLKEDPFENTPDESEPPF